jgi:DNA-binding transcriptional MerR regulator
MRTLSPPSGEAVRSRRGYTAVEAAAITRLTRGRLNYLAAHGIVTPSLTHAGGSRRHYTFAQLVSLRAIARVTGEGNRVSIGAIGPIVQRLGEIDEQQLITSWLAIGDGTALWTDERTGSLTDLLRDRPTTLVVNLGLLERDVEQALAREGLHPPRHRTVQLQLSGA